MAEEYKRKWHEHHNPREDDKVYFGTRLLDAIEKSAIDVYQDERTLEGWEWLNPVSVGTAGAIRTVEGVGTVLANTPVVSQGLQAYGKVADVAAGNVGSLVATTGLDPRFGGWAVRLGEAWYGGQAISAASKSKYARAASKFAKIQADEVGMKASMMMKKKHGKFYKNPKAGVEPDPWFAKDDIGGPQKTYERFQQRRAYGPEYGTENPMWTNTPQKAEFGTRLIDKIDSITNREITSKYNFSPTSITENPITSITNPPNIVNQLGYGNRPIRDWTIRGLFNQNLFKKAKGKLDPDDLDVQSRIMDKIEVLESEISLAEELARLPDGSIDIRKFDPANPLKTLDKKYKGEFLTIKWFDNPKSSQGLNEWRIRWSTTKGGWRLQNRIPKSRNITRPERKLWDRPSPLGKVGRKEIFKTSKERREGAEKLLSHLLASGDPEDLAQYDKIIGASKDSVPFYIEHIHDRRAPVWNPIYKGKTLSHYEHKYKKNSKGQPIRAGDPENLQITGDRLFDTMKTALEDHIYSKSFIQKHGEYMLDLQKDGSLWIRKVDPSGAEGPVLTWKSTPGVAKIYKTETDIPAAIQRLDDIVEGKADDYRVGEVPLSERQETAYSDFYLDQRANDTFQPVMVDDVAIEMNFIKERIAILENQLKTRKYSKQAERNKMNDIIDLNTKLRNLQTGD